jgi:hypothetical protein
MNYRYLAKFKRYLYKSFGLKVNIRTSENGSAIIIALLIMVLLMGFVALAVSRTSNETVASSNDAAETRAFEAAQASLEIMTHNFDKVFDVKLSPDNADLTRIKGQEPDGFTAEYDFDQKINKTQNSEIVVMTGQQFQGLNALRDEWEVETTATDKYNGVEVALKRKFFNNRIPIFQFGIFYEDDLEFHPGPRFDFGGRVHSNRHLFMKANDLYFSSKVTATGEIFTDVMRNGDNTGGYVDNIKIKNASGNYVSLNYDMGSVLRSVPNGNYYIDEVDMPKAYLNANWEANEVLFQGNLLARQNKLDLPLKIASRLGGSELDYIELIKRGKKVGDLHQAGNGSVTAVTPTDADSVVTAQERYYNKAGFRISLADSKAKLPGCATGTGTAAVATACGIRLDGDSNGQGASPSAGSARGYTPRAMQDGYQATRLNGERFYRGSGVETWIKIETMVFDVATNAVVNKDITEDILSLGVTEQSDIITSGGNTKFAITSGNYHGNNTDSRSIVKLQRFIFGGGQVDDAGSTYITDKTWNNIKYNLVIPEDDNGQVDNGSFGSFSSDHSSHMKNAIVEGFTNPKIVPFPIKMFDMREGIYNDNMNTGSEYGNRVPWAGVISIVDIDIANLKRFLDGDFNAYFPNGTPFQIATGNSLKNTDIPDANGWVLYVSDRRGDYDFDGEYDMEDIYGNNDGIKQFGEDTNNNGFLDTDYTNEAVRYTGTGRSIAKGIAATIDHTYYRRGVRLINGERLPGNYDSANPGNTKGFTFASENGVYTLGNYNATGISAVGSPTASTQYLPQDTAAHVPASVIGDAVTLLSRAWTDANSFEDAFNKGNRDAVETTARFALMSGDARSSLIEPGEPNQGGSDIQLTGGVHNFKRTLEDWSGRRLNYAGSLINLYNARNFNSAFKCCNKVYSPPTRNWVFDATFLDPDRLPPGTPFFQTIQLTGFQRLN